MWKYSAFSKAVDVALKTHDSKRGTLVGRHLVIFLLLVVFSVSSEDVSSGKKWSKKMGSSFVSSLLQFIRRSGKEESDMFFLGLIKRSFKGRLGQKTKMMWLQLLPEDVRWSAFWRWWGRLSEIDQNVRRWQARTARQRRTLTAKWPWAGK